MIDHDTSMNLRSQFNARVFQLKSEGVPFSKMADDAEIIRLQRERGYGSWRPSTKSLTNAYAQHCAEVGIDSDGPTAQDTAARDRAIVDLMRIGWIDADIAKAFGGNVKTLSRLRSRL